MTASILARQRILIIEDEMVVAMLLEDMLDELGCTVVATVARPADAVAAIEAQRIDAAILDLNLDGRPSYDVADALSAHGVPFIIATGYGEVGLKQEYRERPVLKKPFRTDDLGRALAKVLLLDPQ